jgi:hypothetical protein
MSRSPRPSRRIAVAAAWVLLVGGAAATAADKRDALFDDEPEPAAKVPAAPEAPARRDALFGADEGKEAKPAPDAKGDTKVFGFYDFVLAYTYGDPTHWSQAVNRFQVGALGDFGGGVKWRLGARVDVDPVYMSGNFYLPDVQRNQRATAFWRENYIDFEAAGWEFRIGAQNIVWGDVVGLFFADVVSARDMREFLLPSLEVIRIPQWAARAEYFKGDAHLELVWIPIQAFDLIGKPGGDFYPVPLPSPTPQSVASLFANPVRPSESLANSAYGVRGNTLAAGWDLAAFYYRAYATQPTFYRTTPEGASSPQFTPRYDRISQAGATVNKDFGEFVAHGELVYAQGQNFATTQPGANEGVVARNTLDWIASVDIPFTQSEGRVNLQVFQRHYFNGGEDAVALKSGSFGASALVSAKVGGVFEPQLLWVQTWNGGGGLVRPRLNWTPAKNLTVGFGVDIFTGASDGYFGRYNNRDRVYTEVRYDL